MLATFLAMATNTQAQLQHILDHLDTSSPEIFEEEMERKRNVVVSSISESTNAKQSLHNKDDLTAITEIFDKINAEATPTSVTAYQLPTETKTSRNSLVYSKSYSPPTISNGKRSRRPRAKELEKIQQDPHSPI
uniref:Neurotrophin-3 n=1 Tax=Acrobeloides nanus TaxID=290746 RepID=A0A914E2Q7_9BILA